jgi:hypothetical protein
MPRNVAATNLVGVNTLERPSASTAHLFTKGTSLGLGNGCLLSGATASYNNTAIGHQALANLPESSGGNNTAVGYAALQSAGTNCANCTAIGHQALKNNTVNNNTAVGINAGSSLTIGVSNTSVGFGAGASIVSGYYNTQVGSGAAGSSGASGTVALGYQTVAGFDYSTAIGYKANAQGAGAVAIGTDSGGGFATTIVANEMKFGTANHRYNFPGQLGAALNAGAKKITNLATPSAGTDAATMAYVDTKATAITPNTGWAVTAGYTVDKAFSPETTTVTEVARVLGTLIDALKAQNILGA